jgi:hypothetical protein
MTTTIKSTDLDFQEIKTNLKTFLKQTGEFNDYDFEGAGLSNLLDVLAYNTHMNALQANFALNESFLVTAQLRPSVVSLAESIGYVPDSKKSSESAITLTLNLTGVAGLLQSQTIQPGALVLRGTKDAVDYTFTNRESLTATGNNGVYTFAPTADASLPVKVFEGDEKSEKFLVGSGQDAVYVIPDQDIDISTAIVKVFENQQSSNIDGGTGFNVYTNLLDATTIDELSRLYVLRESPNQYYELTFGNGNSLGVAPSAGQVIDVNYLRASGDEANNIPTMSLASTLTLATTSGSGYDVDPSNVSISVTTRSAGGGEKEGIESIRLNAPFQYAAQNRMVTSTDYSALILKKYSSFIEDIKSWGGEDDPEPDYGAVFTSIVFKDGLTNGTVSDIRQGILDLADEFSIASFNLKFTDPETTFISIQTFFQWNASLTGFSESNIRSNVEQAISSYFSDNTGKFDQVFRRSNMLSAVDNSDPSVLSSRSTVIVNKRVLPTLGLEENHIIDFPLAIQNPSESTEASVYSSLFSYKNQTVFIRNKLDSRVNIAPAGSSQALFTTSATNTLELVTVGGKVLDNAIGIYDQATGKVSLNGLTVQNIPGGRNYIKIYAIPANQSVVEAQLNNIIKYDPEDSFSKTIKVTTR